MGRFIVGIAVIAMCGLFAYVAVSGAIELFDEGKSGEAWFYLGVGAVFVGLIFRVMNNISSGGGNAVVVAPKKAKGMLDPFINLVGLVLLIAFIWVVINQGN